MMNWLLVGDGGTPERFELCGVVKAMEVENSDGRLTIDATIKVEPHVTPARDNMVFRFLGDDTNFQAQGTITYRKALPGGFVHCRMNVSTCVRLDGGGDPPQHRLKRDAA
ncbi:hypothetical protein [Henriciella aquimarina]|uniref:hypothetical protein n=1 Tax=Henriciella aquimarina TaxID=545261 RepID=UPI0009FE2BE9|nr:hypothetical protein [Henriciella aquimarina]